VRDQDESVSRRNLPVLPCACANLRRAARAVTRLYNQALRRDGIEITQFTVLMALNLTGEITQGAMGGLLALDSTTLSRTLRPLIRRRWIRVREGEDRRQRLLSLTTAGRAKLQQSMPSWTRAQKSLQAFLGHDAFSRLGGVLAEVTAVSLQR
jgi:DNA-binding MarR family transcriptional regulator